MIVGKPLVLPLVMDLTPGMHLMVMPVVKRLLQVSLTACNIYRAGQINFFKLPALKTNADAGRI